MGGKEKRMTYEEAIKELQDTLESLVAEYADLDYDENEDRTAKAFNMAIQALNKYKMATWLYDPIDNLFKCSFCNIRNRSEPNYCPNCGCFMKHEI
jgi:hypothetical protein